MAPQVYVIEFCSSLYTKPCFYVGVSESPEERRRQHEAKVKSGLYWVKTKSFKVYDPSTIYQLPSGLNCGPELKAGLAATVEMILTIEHMIVYGAKYVRGSHFAYSFNNNRREWLRAAYKMAATMADRCWACHAEHQRKGQCRALTPSASSLRTFKDSGISGLGRSDCPILRTIDARERLSRVYRRLAWNVRESQASTSPNSTRRSCRIARR